jgi:hypothetical protein
MLKEQSKTKRIRVKGISFLGRVCAKEELSKTKLSRKIKDLLQVLPEIKTKVSFLFTLKKFKIKNYNKVPLSKINAQLK